MWTAREVQGAGGHEAVEQLRMQALTPGRTFKDLQRGRLVEGADHDGGGYSRTGFGGVRPHVAQTGHYIRQKFGVRDIGGVGSRPGPSDHPAGLALDFMTYTNSAKGAAVARYMVENAAHMAVKYVIWQRRINSGSGWRGMPDRGSPTANHMDHPHVSFLADPRGGRGFTGGGDSGGGDSGGGFMSFVLDQVRNIYNGLTAPIPGAIAALVGNPPPEFRRIPPRMAEITIKSVGDFLFGKAAAADNAAGASGGSGAAGGSPAVTQAVDSVAKGYGWGIGTSQWSALSRLIQKESSWNPNAQNPRSTAYGLFQFLNSTWATVGGTKTSDPRMQAVHGLKYVQQRYRDPVGALSFHDRNNWYDQGGVASGRGIMLKKVLTPERVLSTRQNVGFEQLVAVVTGAYQQRQSPVLTGEQWRTRSGDTSTETTINVEVINPVAERTSQTLPREMRTMSEMGMFG